MSENVCQILSNVGCRCQGQWRASHCPATKWSLRHHGECVVSLGMEYVIFIYVKVKTQLLLCQSRKFCKVPPGWLWEKNQSTGEEKGKHTSNLIFFLTIWNTSPWTYSFIWRNRMLLDCPFHGCILGSWLVHGFSCNSFRVLVCIY